MSTVAAIDALHAADPTFDPNTLSGDALLAYCSSQLGHYDEQIKQRMALQQKSTDQQRAIGQALELLQTWALGVPEKVPDAGPTQGMASGLIEQYNNNAGNPEAQRLLREAYKAVTGNDMALDPSGHAVTYPQGAVPVNNEAVKKVSPEQWQAQFVAPLKQLQDNAGKGSDVSLIEIQSLVSKRQLAVQLTTQIMQAMNDGQKAVAGNVGR